MLDRVTETVTRRVAGRTSRRGFLGVLGGSLVGLGLLGTAGRAAGAPQTMTVVNNSGRAVWVGMLGNPGKGQPNGGGWLLANGQTSSVTVAGDWAGRLWGRTGCAFDGAGVGRCDTGDCGNRLACGGAGGEPPASLAEFTLGNGTASDFYDVSFVDGSNLPMTIDPMGGATDPNDRYRCTRAGCVVDLNPTCPAELRHRNAAGQVVGCKSACHTFGTDQYCCRGAHDRPETCRSSDWPVNYPAYFKSRCPDAYSYAYDDHLSTFTCAGVGYRVTFHPASGGGGEDPGTGFDARSLMQAESASGQAGTITENTGDTGGGRNVGAIGNGDWLRFDGVRFGSSAATQFRARVASGAGPGVSGLVEVRLGSRSNAPVGSFAVGNTGGWQSWRTVPANISGVTGTHTVFVTFASGQPADFVNVNWVQFA